MRWLLFCLFLVSCGDREIDNADSFDLQLTKYINKLTFDEKTITISLKQ